MVPYQWHIVVIILFGSIAVLFVVWTLIQKSKHKRTKEALHTSEERYLFALSGATDGLWDWDIPEGAVFFSDRFMEILGYSPGESPGTIDFIRSCLHPEDAQSAWAAVKNHLQKRTPFKCEFRLRTKSGEYLWFLARAQAIWGAGGKATRMSGWIHDITKDKEREFDLQFALSEINGLKTKLEAERAYLLDEIKFQYNHENIIGQSESITYIFYKIEQIAPTDTTVLILGETGTGKELVARAIHNLSPRKDRALVKINCATLPSKLIESELFGYEKGAFTDARTSKIGRFELAHGTTLFLDEIGELPLELQPKLLRVIESGEFERLGGNKTLKVDVRIIAATNRDLEEEVRQGHFREDLWYRLNVFPITMPPLRERLSDIPLLVEFYVKVISKRLGKTIETIPTSAMVALQNYHWPGNVRELENVLERAVLNSSGTKLRLVDDLKKQYKDSTTAQKPLKEIERDYILKVLEQTRWKVSGKNGAAEILGLDRSTLRARIKKLGIRKP